MKKFIKTLLVAFMLLGFSACSNKNSSEGVNGTFNGKAQGYGGEISVDITLSNSEITSVVAACDAETAGLGQTACEKLSAKMVETNQVEVDAMAGASFSSKGMVEAATAALAAAGLKPTDLKAKEGNQDSATKELDYDVVVIGAGGAGMSAAIEAHDAGAKVLVLEKAAITGGNTTRATGGMNAVGTPEQKEAGIEDSVDLFISDTMKGGKNINDPELVRTLVEKSADGIAWLHSIGADLTNVGLFGGASVKRIHRPVNAEGKTIAVGAYLTPIFTENLEKRNIEVLYETEAKELVSENGKVTGVKASGANGDYVIHAKAVVVATGGFGANAQMVETYQPSLKGFMTTNASTITGDGIKMSVAVGAATVDMDQIQIHPTVEANTAALITEGLRGDGAILVNQGGKRFVNELLTRDVVSAAEIEQEGSYAYLIVDQKMVDASAVIQGYIKKGFTSQGQTYEELAKALNMDEATFADTMNNWNTICANKVDPDFGREGMENDLSTAPYYAIKVSPGVHHTMGGLKIDTETHVLDTNGNVIEGLYAAGEVTGGIHGANRLGGNAVADIVVFGRIAGQQASAYALGK